MIENEELKTIIKLLQDISETLDYILNNQVRFEDERNN